MRINDLVSILKGEIQKPFRNSMIQSFCTDTRNLHKGDAFIALQGTHGDGNDYIKEAIRKKASCIITEKDSIQEKIPVIKVESTYDSLFVIASYYKEKYNPFMIGITGSSGKTTTKELLYTVLSTQYNVLKNEKNYNNHIGVPLTLMNLDERYDIVLAEIGMNHAHEIEKLSKLVEPNLAIITGIGTSHIGNLKSKRNIWKAKMEIVEGMKDGILLVNGDDPYLKKCKSTEEYNTIHCGYHSTYQLIPYDVKEELERLTYKLFYQQKEHEIILHVTGKHFLIDSLLVIETALLFGIPMEDIVTSLGTYMSLDKRMNIIYQDHFTVIDDCYNASYESYKGVLAFVKQQKNKKILILGDMLELGTYTKSLHKKLHKQIRKIKGAEVLTLGESMKYLKGYKVTHFKNKEDMKSYIEYMDLDNTLIVIKGARGMHLEEIRDYIVKSI